jgi:AhpD family alkylhydroperoxidase
MSKSFGDLTTHISAGTAKLREAAPEAMAGFYAMSKGAMKAGVLSEIDKELIALAIGVSTQCEGCIGFHTKALVRLKAKREQVMEALAVAVYMGGGPALMYAAEAVHAFDEFAAKADSMARPTAPGTSQLAP